MPAQWPDALIIAPWPKVERKYLNARAEKEFAMVMDIVRAIRNARTEFNVEPGKRIPAIISAGAAHELLASQRETIALLARLDLAEFIIEKRAARPAQALTLVIGKVEIYLPLSGMIDVEKEKARLTSEIAKINADITRAENLLAGEFAKRAPKEVVQKTRDQLAANRERVAKLDTQLASLEGRANAPKPTPITPAKPKRTATKKTAKRGARAPAKKAAAKKTTRKTSKKKRILKRQ